MERSPVHAGLLVCLTLAVCLPATAEPSEDELAQAAEKFSRQFLDGEHEANLELMNAPMKAASGADRSEPVRQQLIAGNGAVKEIGSAWYQDELQGYLRYRVPVTFELATLDFRVVFEKTGLIAGFGIERHLDPPQPVESTPARQEDVKVGDGATALPGILTLPDGDGPFPAVVLVHGSGPNDRDETRGPNKPFRDLAWGLAERGVASLRYDKRSFARPADLVALGDELTVKQETIDDARLALAALSERKEIDGENLYVIGHSLGGMVLPRIGSPEPRPAGLISLAGGALPLHEVIAVQVPFLVNFDGVVTPDEQAYLEMVENSVTTLQKALDGSGPAPPGQILGVPFGYWKDLAEHDPPAGAAKLGLPILVLQGERDYQVTMDHHRAWEAALASKPFACLVTYEKLDHLFRPGSGPPGPTDYESQVPVDTAVIDDIAAWIVERKCPDRP